ncbi:hypothetical protein ACOBV9_18775 (plasmid) [Pseudoalteromonas espejiana]
MKLLSCATALIILRGGKVSGHCIPKNETSESIARLMVGDSTPSNQTRRAKGTGDFLTVNNLSTNAQALFDTPLKILTLPYSKAK